MPKEDDPFPFVYQCVTCGREATVTRSDAQEISSSPDMFGAMAVLLRRRGWAHRSKENALYCPDCAEDSP